MGYSLGLRWLAVAVVAAACSSNHSATSDAGRDGTSGGDGAHDSGQDSGDAPSTQIQPHLIPGPGQAGFDDALAVKAGDYDRQFHTFAAMPFGLSLDAMIPSSADRDLVTAFMGQHTTSDFAAFTAQAGNPRSVRDIVSSYEDHGDLGMFGGVTAAADAFRYIALRDGEPGGDVAGARADLLRAIGSFHIAATITGTPGSVARGIKRIDEPGTPPSTVALPGSCPAPLSRGDTWRADGSGQYPEWIYDDNNSKDQMIGYVFALGAFWDAISGDPTIQQSVRDQLQHDALDLAQSLMQPVTLGISSVDLVIRDWMSCPTQHMDLNPRIVPVGTFPLVLAETDINQNGWNALAALGIVRTLYHVTGNAAVGHYYYAELIGHRDYPHLAVTGIVHVGAMYQDNGSVQTNFSNVNMAFVAAYGVLRYETDPALRARFEAILETELWNAGAHHDGKSIQQALFNLIDSAFRADGNHAPTTSAALGQLNEFVAPPYFDYSVENCDAGELAAGSCTAIDGTTQITLLGPGNTTSRDPLPKHLRPPSDFEWRSDPRSVNGGGSIRLNAGGDFRAAYWMGRLLYAADAGSANVSPVARQPVP